MNFGAYFVALLLAFGLQQPDAPPGLARRPAGAPPEQSVKVVLEGGKTVLPQDAYGLYRFADREGEFGEGLQINEQFGEVSGYFSIAVGAKSKGKLSTYFLSEVKGGNGQLLSFTTRLVHGVSYSFVGKVSRGPGLSRAQDGFYLLDGTLTSHDDAQKASQVKTISLKLTAEH